MYLWSYDHFVIANLVFIVDIYIYDEVVITILSPISSCVVSFLSLCTCFFLFCMQSFYFCFKLKCLDKFCLKIFKNTDCQSLLAMNSLLAKFFKSLC